MALYTVAFLWPSYRSKDKRQPLCELAGVMITPTRGLVVTHKSGATHFDPRILDALLAAKNEVMEFDKTYADEHG